MPIDTAPYISGMDLTSPSNRDPRVEGPGQMRAIKTVMKNCFPNVGGEVTADHVKMNQVFQAGLPTVGMIMMFGGSTAPAGWAFCDGTASNNIVTPDLRNRFILGWNPNGVSDTNSDSYIGDEKTVPGDSGGAHLRNIGDSITVDGHSLTQAELPDINLTVDMTAHNYSLGEYVTGDVREIPGEDKRFTSNRYPVAKLGGNGSEHSHDITSKATDVRPAWYALAYIMYVGFPTT